MSAAADTPFSGQRVVLTGATGFIGAHLAHRLRADGADLSLIVRSAVAAARRLPGLDGNAGGPRWIEADLTRRESLRAALRALRPRFVFHLAADTSGDRSPEHASTAVAVNFQGTVNLLDALDTSATEHVVTIGTAEEYGPGAVPFREDQAPLPLSPYSASKAAATAWCGMAHRAFGLPVTVLRLFLVYGPGQPPVHLIPQAIAAAQRGEDFATTRGEQTRDFIYVDDVVGACCLAATTPAAGGEVINVASGEERTVRDVITRIYREVDGPGRPALGALPYREPEIWRYVGSNQKARDLLGWVPRIGFDEGLRRTVASYAAGAA